MGVLPVCNFFARVSKTISVLQEARAVEGRNIAGRAHFGAGVIAEHLDPVGVPRFRGDHRLDRNGCAGSE